MKSAFFLSALALSAGVESHGIWQKIKVNGADQGSLVGLRAPSNNNPVQDATSSSIACGAGGSTSGTVIQAAAGAQISAWFQHVIGGPQGSNDADNPIAASHKGPISAYLAKVDNAVSASATGASWFKVWEDTFDTGSRQWGVDHMISNNGWVSFNLPSCIAAGQYLLRIEIAALHSAGSQGGVQFYTSCAQLQISGGGGTTPSNTVKFPGAYSNTGPDILISIYGSSGKPDNNGKAYPAHGPSVFRC